MKNIFFFPHCDHNFFPCVFFFASECWKNQNLSIVKRLVFRFLTQEDFKHFTLPSGRLNYDFHTWEMEISSTFLRKRIIFFLILLAVVPKFENMSCLGFKAELGAKTIREIKCRFPFPPPFFLSFFPPFSKKYHEMSFLRYVVPSYLSSLTMLVDN